MQVELSQLTLEGLALELPPHEVEGISLPARKANIRSAEALRGTMRTGQDGGDRVRLEGVAASELILSALDWHFGKKVFLASDRSAKLGGLRAQIGSGEADFDLDVELASLQAERLRLSVGALKIEAELDALSLQLAVHGDDVGYLRAEQALLKEFELHTGDITLRMPALRVRKLLVDWGGELFRLEAEAAEGEALQLLREGSELSAEKVSLRAFGLHGDDVRLEQARFAKIVLEVSLPSASPAEPQAAERRPDPAKPVGAAKGAPLFAWQVLDELAGHMNVDLEVDMKVPILGHRRATHELRIPIEDGAIDYRELESNLARLEDSLIDFAVRDGALVLELGLPLIPTRGRGKPILRWDLSPDDLALAEDRRVRLAVLPEVRSATASEAPRQEEKEKEKDKESGVRLRSLSAQNVDAVLRLLPGGPYPASLRALSFSSLQLAGDVHHDPDGEPREGTLRGSLQDLHGELKGLPVGSSALDATLDLGALRELAVRFLDLRPTRIRGNLDELALSGVMLAAPGRAAAGSAPPPSSREREEPASPITSASANPS